MLCSLVCDRVTTCGLTLSEGEKLALFRRYYFEQCQVVGEDSYLQENLFKHLPEYFKRDDKNKLEWPPFYTTYIRDKYETKKLSGVQRNRTRRLANVTEEQGMEYNFSEAIKTASSLAKTEINNRLSRLWRDPLDSGETPSGLLDVIRETTRRRDCYLRAKVFVHNKVTAKKRQGPEYEDMLNSKLELLLSDSDVSHFPNYWLTFVLFASPAPQERQLTIFRTQNISDLQEKIVTIDGTTNKSLNKNSRKMLKYGPGTGSSGSGRGSGRPPASMSSTTSDDPYDLTEDSETSSRLRGANVMHVQHSITVPTMTAPKDDSSEEGVLRSMIKALQEAGKNADGTCKHSSPLAASHNPQEHGKGHPKSSSKPPSCG